MPTKKYKPEQIVSLLRQIEVAVANGKSTPQACRDAGITEQSYYRWRKEYGGLTSRPNGSKCWRRRTRAISGWWRSCHWRSRSCRRSAGETFRPRAAALRGTATFGAGTRSPSANVC
jgi:hypothetical protein